MPYPEIPSDDTVVSALEKIGDNATASELCDRLVELKHSRRASQLAIQRTVERGRISIGSDWKLSVAKKAVAA
ncbi:hypothetical protein EDC90_101917 [Martelella mediterranea]|uniref:Uncharacterized protein n=1 Tax=Martelella mediterranea TaxID=293089 RepID=A0A4R3NQX9_9HYPH|nr:hypothetical protein EDC90_101917 [Martelella mediterranea]